MWPDGGGPNMLLDDGGDATLLVHKGAEFEKAGKIPAFDAKNDPEEWGVILATIAKELKERPGAWSTIATRPQPIWPASRMRCASPPDSVGALRSSVR